MPAEKANLGVRAGLFSADYANAGPPPEGVNDLKRLLIANRGEIAIRIARTAAEMGLATLAVFAEDDAASLHTRVADEAAPLTGSGVAAYLDADQIIAVAVRHSCDAIHPGYGFLSENADFARKCGEAGITFVGPSPEALAIFGDKSRALELASREGVPVLTGTRAATSLDEARGFLEGLGTGGAVMLKALAGGGGRGMRPVIRLEDLPAAFERCQSEAAASFGNGDLYVETLLADARHVEVQIVGDGTGQVVHLWDRECSVQRQRQKIIELAPAIGVPAKVREALFEAAVRLGKAVRYKGLGTIEFLVASGEGGRFAFIEANPRLQVEHTVTEEVTGLDLVRLQLAVAGGASLAELGLTQAEVPAPRGVAIQARVNLESMTADGQARPSGGVLSAYEPPAGPGVRVDGFGYAGYETSTRFDSLLAKLIVHADDLATAVIRARRALGEFKVVGTKTNVGFLQALLASPALSADELHTRYVEEHAGELLKQEAQRTRYFEAAPASAAAAPTQPGPGVARAGAKIDPNDPLAVLSLRPGVGTGVAVETLTHRAAVQSLDGTEAVAAPIQGAVIQISAQVGDLVRLGQPVALMEALKMEHVITSTLSGVVRRVALAVGDVVFEGAPILFVEPAEVEGGAFTGANEIDLDQNRADVAQVRHFHQLTTDSARAEQTAKRHAQGKRTARENIADLCDEDSFMEYGPTVTAGRLRTDTFEEIEQRVLKTAADGMVIGVGRVNGELVGRENARCAVMSYDYTVLAGTQGIKNHQKTDRMFGVAREYRLPLVFYTEGGGGRTSGERGGPSAAGANWASSAAWCRWSASSPATALRATLCCWARWT
jgi:acetyl/propionyl-CoA carboxylase alpha subunit